MGYTYKQLKSASEIVAEKFNLTDNDAIKIIQSFAGGAAVGRILAGDFSDVKPTAKKLNIYISGNNKEAAADAGGLPLSLADSIKELLKNWAADNCIELEKCSGLQWRAACLFIGMWIKSQGLLYDKEHTKTNGGYKYDAGRVADLVGVWEYITTLYKHVPLHTDFIAFSGVSRQWFFDYEGRGLTSTCVQIVKKVMDIENAGISAGLADSRENPTGRIFYAKARLGWRENDTIQQIDDKSGGNNNALPVFDLPKLP